MTEPGRFYTLTVADEQPQGLYLNDTDGGRILLPRRQVPDNTAIGDELTVFVYLDSEDRLIATTQQPRAAVGEVAFLQAVDVNSMGAFLDWGLAKDLFVPFAEQKQRMEKGHSYAVYVTLDNTGRIIGSTRLNRFIRDEITPSWPGAPMPLQTGDKVSLLITQRTELGYKAVVNNQYWGVLHNDDVRKAIRVGQQVKGYVKRVRTDHRLDLMLEPAGHGKADPLAKRILKKLEEGNGTLGLNDYSPADLIELHFGVSKRTFKMAIGKLFKERKIVIEDNGIRLATDADQRQPRPEKAPRPAAASSSKDSGKDSSGPKPAKKVYRNPKKKSASTLSLKKP